MSKRHNARQYALQALYQWGMTGCDLNTIEQQILTRHGIEKNPKKLDLEYFIELLHKIPAQLDTLDNMISPNLDRPLDKLDLIELTLLRMGAYELAENKLPKKVIINEAIELAKKFGGEDGYKYINSILDTIKK